MKNKKNRIQRQEVRRILTVMRRELKEYPLHYEDIPSNRPVMHLDEVLKRALSLSQKIHPGGDY